MVSIMLSIQRKLEIGSENKGEGEEEDDGDDENRIMMRNRGDEG